MPTIQDIITNAVQTVERDGATAQIRAAASRYFRGPDDIAMNTIGTLLQAEGSTKSKHHHAMLVATLLTASAMQAAAKPKLPVIDLSDDEQVQRHRHDVKLIESTMCADASRYIDFQRCPDIVDAVSTALLIAAPGYSMTLLDMIAANEVTTLSVMRRLIAGREQPRRSA